MNRNVSLKVTGKGNVNASGKLIMDVNVNSKENVNENVNTTGNVKWECEWELECGSECEYKCNCAFNLNGM